MPQTRWTYCLGVMLAALIPAAAGADQNCSASEAVFQCSFFVDGGRGADDVWFVYDGSAKRERNQAAFAHYDQNVRSDRACKDRSATHKLAKRLENGVDDVGGQAIFADVLGCREGTKETRDRDLMRWFERVDEYPQLVHDRTNFHVALNGYRLAVDSFRTRTDGLAVLDDVVYTEDDPFAFDTKIKGCVGPFSLACAHALAELQKFHHGRGGNVFFWHEFHDKQTHHGLRVTLPDPEAGTGARPDQRWWLAAKFERFKQFVQGLVGAVGRAVKAMSQVFGGPTKRYCKSKNKNDKANWKSIYAAGQSVSGYGKMVRWSLPVFAAQRAALAAAIQGGYVGGRQPVAVPPGAVTGGDAWLAQALTPFDPFPGASAQTIATPPQHLLIEISAVDRGEAAHAWIRDLPDDVQRFLGRLRLGGHRLKLTAYRVSTDAAGRQQLTNVGAHVFAAPLIWAHRLLVGEIGSRFVEIPERTCEFREGGGFGGKRRKQMRWAVQVDTLHADYWPRMVPLLRGAAQDFTRPCPNAGNRGRFRSAAADHPTASRALDDLRACNQRQRTAGSAGIWMRPGDWVRLLQYDAQFRLHYSAELVALKQLIWPEDGVQLAFNRKVALDPAMLVFRKFDVDVVGLIAEILYLQTKALVRILKDPVKIAQAAPVLVSPGAASVLCAIPETWGVAHTRVFRKDQFKPDFLDKACRLLFRPVRHLLEEALASTEAAFENVRFQGFLAVRLPLPNGQQQVLRVLLPDLYSPVYAKLFRGLFYSALMGHVPTPGLGALNAQTGGSATEGPTTMKTREWDPELAVQQLPDAVLGRYALDALAGHDGSRRAHDVLLALADSGAVAPDRVPRMLLDALQLEARLDPDRLGSLVRQFGRQHDPRTWTGAAWETATPEVRDQFAARLAARGLGSDALADWQSKLDVAARRKFNAIALQTLPDEAVTSLWRRLAAEEDAAATLLVAMLETPTSDQGAATRTKLLQQHTTAPLPDALDDVQAAAAWLDRHTDAEARAALFSALAAQSNLSELAGESALRNLLHESGAEARLTALIHTSLLEYPQVQPVLLSKYLRSNAPPGARQTLVSTMAAQANAETVGAFWSDAYEELPWNADTDIHARALVEAISDVHGTASMVPLLVDLVPQSWTVRDLAATWPRWRPSKLDGAKLLVAARRLEPDLAEAAITEQLRARVDGVVRKARKLELGVRQLMAPQASAGPLASGLIADVYGHGQLAVKVNGMGACVGVNGGSSGLFLSQYLLGPVAAEVPLPATFQDRTSGLHWEDVFGRLQGALGAPQASAGDALRNAEAMLTRRNAQLPFAAGSPARTWLERAPYGALASQLAQAADGLRVYTVDDQQGFAIAARRDIDSQWPLLTVMELYRNNCAGADALPERDETIAFP